MIGSAWNPTKRWRPGLTKRSGVGTCRLAAVSRSKRSSRYPRGPRFDTILYVDVLEHIEKDYAEVALSARRLKPGGHLIALSPAHCWLYSPFDQAIGHFRRYTKQTFAGLTPPVLEIICLRYLDSVGMLASLGNRLILNRSMPRATASKWGFFIR